MGFFSESNRGRGGAVVVGLPQAGATPIRNAYTAPGGHVTLITLNTESKYFVVVYNRLSSL